MYIQSQLRCSSAFISSITKSPTPFESHDALHENDGIPNCLRSIHIELRRDLYIEHLQFEIWSHYDLQSFNEIMSSRYMHHFELLIYPQLFIGTAQIEQEWKPENLVLKMSICSLRSVQHTQSYDHFFWIPFHLKFRVYTVKSECREGLPPPLYTANRTIPFFRWIFWLKITASWSWPNFLNFEYNEAIFWSVSDWFIWWLCAWWSWSWWHMFFRITDDELGNCLLWVYNVLHFFIKYSVVWLCYIFRSRPRRPMTSTSPNSSRRDEPESAGDCGWDECIWWYAAFYDHQGCSDNIHCHTDHTQHRNTWYNMHGIYGTICCLTDFIPAVWLFRSCLVLVSAIHFTLLKRMRRRGFLPFCIHSTLCPSDSPLYIINYDSIHSNDEYVFQCRRVGDDY